MKKLISQIEEAKLINQGLSDVNNNEVLDGETVMKNIADKYGFKK